MGDARPGRRAGGPCLRARQSRQSYTRRRKCQGDPEHRSGSPFSPPCAGSAAQEAARDAFLRSLALSMRLRRRMDLGVTSISSSSAM